MPTSAAVLTVLGVASILLAGTWFAFKLYIAYVAARRPGEAGGVPTLDGALFPPVPLVLGLWVLRSAHPDWPHLDLFILWIVATVLGVVIHLVIAGFIRPAR